MQPPYGGTPCVVIRALTRNCRVVRNARGFGSYNAQGILLSRRYASSKAPIPSKKPASKPLPYKSGPSRLQLNERALQQQQQQQQGEKQQQRAGSNKAPIADLVRDRWLAILGYGSALGCLGYFTASLAMYWREEPAPCHPLGCEPETPTGRPSIQSPYEFDLHLDKSEWRYGITKLRRELGAGARGHILEVAIGTGRNLEFFNWDTVTASLLTPEEREKARTKSTSWIPGWGGRSGAKAGAGAGEHPNAVPADKDAVLSFTGVDISPGMLDIALQRTRLVIPHMTDKIPKKPSFAMLAVKNGSNSESPQQGHVVSFLSDRLRLVQSDVQTALPAPPTLSPSAPQKYDTILQTFGLCSVQDPVSLLCLMASSLQPNTGRILLLEHGRSVWDLVNGLLDRGARGHYARFGCWWNRDIEVIVHEAARRIPGLQILRLERPGWATAGTHVVVELRVRDPSTEQQVIKRKKPPANGWGSILSPILSVKKTADNAKKSD